MTVYAVLKLFSYTIGVAGTPYTLSECVKSLEVITPIPELESAYFCIRSATRPKIQILPPHLQKLVEEHMRTPRNRHGHNLPKGTEET